MIIEFQIELNMVSQKFDEHIAVTILFVNILEVVSKFVLRTVSVKCVF